MISCAEAVPIGNRCDFQSHNGDEEESPRERTIQVRRGGRFKTVTRDCEAAARRCDLMHATRRGVERLANFLQKLQWSVRLADERAFFRQTLADQHGVVGVAGHI
jgi:hypothetical protein